MICVKGIGFFCNYLFYKLVISYSTLKRTFVAGILVKPGPGAKVNTSFQFLLATQANDEYNQVGYIEYGSNNNLTEWRDLSGLFTVPVNATSLTVYVQSTDKTIDFEVDQAFWADPIENIDTLVAGPFSIFDKWFEVEYDTAWDGIAEGQTVKIKAAGYYEKEFIIADDIRTRSDDLRPIEHRFGGENSADGMIRGYRFWHGHRNSVSDCTTEIAKTEYKKCGPSLCLVQPRFKNAAQYGVCLLTDEINGEQGKYRNQCTDTCNSYGYCSDIFIPTWPNLLLSAGTERACTAVTTLSAWTSCECETGTRERTPDTTCQYGSGDSAAEVQCGENDQYKAMLTNENQSCGNGIII